MKLRIFKKTLSLLLAAVLVFSSLPVFVFAASAKNEDPVIFIAGFASTPTVDLNSGERVFPPSFDDLKPVLQEYAVTMLRGIFRERYELLEEPLVSALYQAFDAIRCDEDGNPILPATSTSYVPPTGEELRAKRDPAKGYTAEDSIYYSFDWRLDLKTLAENLHDFIEYVLAETGAQKVRLIGSSMGGCVLATYMDMYDYEYISGAVFLSAAFQGTSVAGEPMTGAMEFDSGSLMTFLSAVMGRDIRGDLLNTLVDSLYQLGLVDTVTLRANLMQYTLQSVVNDQALKYIFGRIPGFWSLVPYEYYDAAKETMTNGIVSDVFYEKIDFYHEIQGRIPALLQAGMDSGVPISIVSKYGLPSIPAMPSQGNMSDMVVDTCYSSLGADCAPVNAPFTDRSGEYVSPDGYIDASTCAFPETTWFLKNVSHTAHPDCEWIFLNTLLSCETQPTVDTFAEYPRFLIQTQEGKIVPLTAETDFSLFSEPATRSTGFVDWMNRLFTNYVNILIMLFHLLEQSVGDRLSEITIPMLR